MIRREYSQLKVSADSGEAFDLIRESFSELHSGIERLPASRARSIALTKLEEASHFAIRACAEAFEVK